MTIELSTSNRMEIDEVCFQRSETQDYKLEDLVFPPDPSSKHLIDYRVKLLLKNDLVLGPGQEGYISELFSGRIHVKLANYKSETVKLYGGTEVGFLIVNNFSMN